MSNFRIGQKVTLRNGNPWVENEGEISPVFGEIYTVRAFIFDEDGGSLLLNEIHNEPEDFEDGFCEVIFDALEFRAVVERKTDISIFTKMLDGSRVLETTVTKG